MELDSFLASPRWDIIQIITKNPSSPMEIAEQIGTTISFVSQQLKLLEAAGIVKKERTGAVEKGKPRTLFSIARERAYIVPLAKNLPEKKLLDITKEHKIILSIWGIEDKKIHSHLQKFFWKIEPFLEDINAIFVYLKDLLPKIYIVSKGSSLTHKINETLKSSGEKANFQVVSSASPVSKLETDNLVAIYDPEEILEKDNLLKGGEANND